MRRRWRGILGKWVSLGGEGLRRESPYWVQYWWCWRVSLDGRHGRGDERDMPPRRKRRNLLSSPTRTLGKKKRKPFLPMLVRDPQVRRLASGHTKHSMNTTQGPRYVPRLGSSSTLTPTPTPDGRPTSSAPLMCLGAPKSGNAHPARAPPPAREITSVRWMVGLSYHR